jgi:hypothetical protein
MAAFLNSREEYIDMTAIKRVRRTGEGANTDKILIKSLAYTARIYKSHNQSLILKYRFHKYN